MSRKKPWPPTRLGLIEKQLDQLAQAVANGNERDVDDQIWLTRFLVIRASGYLEQVVHETVVGHLQETSYGRARSFVMSWLERSRNPSIDNLMKLVGRLDANLQQELGEFLEADGKKLHREISLLVGRRNQIAHGENEGMGSKGALELVTAAKEVAAWFILRLDPHQPSGRSSKP